MPLETNGSPQIASVDLYDDHLKRTIVADDQIRYQQHKSLAERLDREKRIASNLTEVSERTGAIGIPALQRRTNVSRYSQDLEEHLAASRKIADYYAPILVEQALKDATEAGVEVKGWDQDNNSNPPEVR